MPFFSLSRKTDPSSPDTYCLTHHVAGALQTDAAETVDQIKPAQARHHADPGPLPLLPREGLHAPGKRVDNRGKQKKVAVLVQAQGGRRQEQLGTKEPPRRPHLALRPQQLEGDQGPAAEQREGPHPHADGKFPRGLLAEPARALVPKRAH